MMILMQNNFDFFVMIFMFLLISIPSLKFNGDERSYFEKETTNTLKGLSMIVVVFHHISLFVTENNVYTLLFRYAGFLAVTIFLLLSGYGLNIQALRRKNYLKGFILDKIFRVLLTFLISSIVVTIINNVFLKTNYTIWEVIKATMKLSYPNGRELWFVAIIIFCYVVFYIANKLCKQYSIYIICLSPILYIALCIIYQKGNWWYNTAFCFAIGTIVATYKDKIFAFFSERFNYMMPISIGVFVAFMYAYTIRGITQIQYLIPIVLILLLCILLTKVNFKSNLLDFFNTITFEMYLTHLIILKVAFQNNTVHQTGYLLITLPIMVLLAYITHLISDFVFKKIRAIKILCLQSNTES